MVKARNVLKLLADSILDQKLASKINRISRELKDEAEIFEDATKKIQEDLVERWEKFSVELGGIKTPQGRNYSFEFGKDNAENKRKSDLFFMEESKNAAREITILGDEDRPFTLKSEKLTKSDIEEAKFRTDHNFLFSQLELIEQFVKE